MSLARNGNLGGVRFPISLASPPARVPALAATIALLAGCTTARPGRSRHTDESAPRVTAPADAVTGTPPAPTTSSVAPAAAAPPAAAPPPAIRSEPPVVRSVPTPAGPERTSDNGDRTLKPSPIGQLAPEEAPPPPPPPPPRAPGTSR